MAAVALTGKFPYTSIQAGQKQKSGPVGSDAAGKYHEALPGRAVNRVRARAYSRRQPSAPGREPLVKSIRFAILAFAGACTALAAQSACAQKLYKHVDEKGVVTYTDIPDKPKDKPMSVDNTKRNGDHTDKQNANLSNISNQSDWRFRQKMQQSGNTQTARETPPASSSRDSSRQ
jgi:hypothetical protein